MGENSAKSMDSGMEDVFLEHKSSFKNILRAYYWTWKKWTFTAKEFDEQQ